jgi:hypothetical protein
MDEARVRMEAQSVSAFAIDPLLAIAAYQKPGGPTAMVSDKVERILGRPPRTFPDDVQLFRRHRRATE